jgi:hypothetical protein
MKEWLTFVKNSTIVLSEYWYDGQSQMVTLVYEENPPEQLPEPRK